MRPYIVIGFIFQFVIFSPTLAQTLPEKWAEKATKTVVFIDIPVTNKDLGGIDHITGTGFIISKNGHILTAHHILKKWLKQNSSEKEKNEIIGGVGGKESPDRYPLELVDFDDQLDVALMKFNTPKDDFQQLPLCFYPKISLGGSFVAFGYPLGEGLHATPGTIGNDDAIGGRWAASSAFTYGMSGGPIFNESGVIGIVKGGAEGEPAVRWITPVRLAKNYAEKAPEFLECNAKDDLRAMVFTWPRPAPRSPINTVLEEDVSNSLYTSFTTYRIDQPKFKSHMSIRSFKHLSETERNDLRSFVSCNSLESSSQIWKLAKYITTIEYYRKSSQDDWSIHIEIFKIDGVCDTTPIAHDAVYNDQSGWSADDTAEFLLKNMGLWSDEKHKVLLLPPLHCEDCAANPEDLSLIIPEYLERNINNFPSFPNVQAKNLNDQDRHDAKGEDLPWFADQDQYKSVTHFLPGEIELIDQDTKHIFIHLELYQKPGYKDYITSGYLDLPATSKKGIIKYLLDFDVLVACCKNNFSKHFRGSK